MKKFYCIALLAAAMFTACDKTPSGTDSVPGAITISPLVTRVSDMNFDDGDRIGLTIVKEGGEIYANNYPMTYSGNVFSGNLMWYADNQVKSSMYAYYPYSEAGQPTSFTVQSDQSEGTSSSDLVIGVNTDVTPTSSTIGMTFRHMLTKIVVEVANNTTGSQIASVVLQGSKTTADVNVAESTVEVSASSETGDVTAWAVADNERYNAIIVPQEVALTLKVTMDNGDEYTSGLASTSYVQGGQYTATVRLSEESGLEVKVAGDIEGWEDEGEIGPADPGTETGTIEYQGVTYRTVTLSNGSTWMIDPMRYVPEGYTPSDDPTAEAHIWYPYKNDGTGAAVAATDEETIAAKGYLYDMYAALGVTSEELTAETAASFEGAQGICPDGWHIPTWQEFFDLCGYSNRTATVSSPQTNPDALFYDATLNGGSIIEFNAAGWNFVCSGTRMKSGFSATAKYQNMWVAEGILEGYVGEPSLNYFMTSTFYQAGSSNLQFMAASTTFNATYPGRLTMMFSHCECGMQLRCVKDAVTE